MTIASQGSARDLPQALKIAQEAMLLPDVQEMLRKLSDYQLGIFMPHMHGEASGEFQPLPEGILQVESGLEVSSLTADAIVSQTNRFLLARSSGGTMKASVIEVSGLLSVFGVDAVEVQITEVPGVESATVNFAAGNATVRYDETQVDVADIKAAIRYAGSHSTPDRSAPGVAADAAHVDAPPDTTTAVATPALDTHKGHATTKAQPAMAADMAHDMGHGGTDLAAMVRDMGNRFWICLLFTVSIFLYAPMGGMFKPPAPPFGLELNLWLFLLASAAIVYPSWPFFVSAWRALRKGVLGIPGREHESCARSRI